MPPPPTAPAAVEVGVEAELAPGDRLGNSAFSFGHSEAMPPGRNSMTTMNSAPWK